MPCFLPFDSNGLDVSLSVLRLAGVSADEHVAAVKPHSSHAEDLGCLRSAILKSIHGNIVVWYGSRIKRTDDEDRRTLNQTMASALMARVAGMAVVLCHGFFDVYAGESKDGRPAAWFATGDAIFMNGMVPSSSASDGSGADLPYGCLAVLRSCFRKEAGLSASACLLQHRGDAGEALPPLVVTFLVWRSLHECYGWLLQSDYRNTIRPYVSHLYDDVHSDVFRVVFVSSDDAAS